MTIQIDKTIKEKIVLALDVDTIDEAKKLINELKDYVGVFKVGLQLYTKCGNEIIKFMNDENIKYFLDVKLYDIPNTVKEASKNIIEKGACFFNVHALGGYKMMNEAVNAANEAYFKKTNQNETKPIVLGVTILTSINDDVLHSEFEIENQAENLVAGGRRGRRNLLTGPEPLSGIRERFLRYAVSQGVIGSAPAAHSHSGRGPAFRCHTGVLRKEFQVLFHGRPLL